MLRPASHAPWNSLNDNMTFGQKENSWDLVQWKTTIKLKDFHWIVKYNESHLLVMSWFQWGREDGHQVFIQSRLINSGDLGRKIWTLGKIIRNITSSSSNSEWPAFRLKQLHHRVLQRGTFQNSGLVLSLTNHHPIVFNGGWVAVILEVAEASDWGHWGT